MSMIGWLKGSKVFHRAEHAAINSFSGPQRRTAIVIGDSLVDNGLATSNGLALAATHSWMSRSLFGWINSRLGAPWDVMGEYGHAGKRTDEILSSYFPTEVVPYRPSLVVVVAGTNDWDAGRTATQVWDTMISMYRTVSAWGGRLLYLHSTAMYRASMYERAAFLARCRTCLPQDDPRFRFIDVWGRGVDYSTSATLYDMACAKPLTADLAGDATHPSARHIFKAAKYVAAQLTDWAPAGRQFSATGRYINSSGATLTWTPSDINNQGDPSTVSHNSCMGGPDVAVATPAGFSGNRPTGYGFFANGGGTGPTGVASRVDALSRTDNRPGSLFRWTFSGASSRTNESGILNSGNSGRINGFAGDAYYVQSMAYVKATASTGVIRELGIQLSILDSASSTLKRITAGTSFDLTNAYHDINATEFEGVLVTPRWLINGDGTYSVGNPSLFTEYLYCSTQIDGSTAGGTGVIDVGNFETVVTPVGWYS